MNVDFNNLNAFIRKETFRVIKETLESQLGDDNDEKRRQKNLARTVKKRGLHAGDDAKDVDEAEVEEEVEVEEETQETGVPDPEDDPREDRTRGKGTADSPKLATPTDAQIEKVTAKNVIDKINVLRGGESLKNPTIRKSFTQYFNGLTHSERESLLVYLTGLSQILAGVSDGGEVIDPGDVGLRVKGSVKSTAQAKDQKEKQSKEKETGSEDAPIIVGEAQNKFLIKKMYEAYKRYE